MSDETRKPIISGNWKMNHNHFEAIQCVQKLAYLLTKDDFSAVDVTIHPPFTDLRSVQTLIDADELKFILGAQHCHEADTGAFTGEVSAVFLTKLNVSYVIVGHSERREIFHESEELIKQKVDAAISHEIGIVFCCGEPLHIRENETQSSYVKHQLIDSLFHLSDTEIQTCVIAYEPIWAIGTGRTASVEEAEEMHYAIRSWITEFYNSEIEQAKETVEEYQSTIEEYKQEFTSKLNS